MIQNKVGYLLHIYTKYNNIKYIIHKKMLGEEKEKEKEKESREV